MNRKNIIKINPSNIDIEKVKIAAKIIQKGGLVAFPTETVYGIGADTFNKNAITKIYTVKRRPANDPIIVHLSNFEQLNDVVLEIPPITYKIVDKFWPGPLTLILIKNPLVPSEVSAGLPTIAVRMPSHQIARSLIELSGKTIAAPSANLFAKPSPTKANHVIEDLGSEIDLIIDGGKADIGIESTVLDLTGDIPTILRPGGISFENIKSIIPKLIVAPKYLSFSSDTNQESSSSPGMLVKHYSPIAKLLLFQGHECIVLEKMKRYIDTFLKQGKKIGILCVNEEIKYFQSTDIIIYSLGSIKNLSSIANSLFDGMRTLDNQGINIILVRSYSEEGIGLAIWDRLYRAAEGKVIKADTLNPDI